VVLHAGQHARPEEREECLGRADDVGLALVETGR